MFKILKRLIERKYYEDREDIEMKVNVFYGYSVINDDEYADLMELLEINYPIEIVEDTIEEQEEIIEEVA